MPWVMHRYSQMQIVRSANPDITPKETMARKTRHVLRISMIAAVAIITRWSGWRYCLEW
jgi:hypothetical protein